MTRPTGDAEPVRNYPIRQVTADPRFSFALLIDVCVALDKHGYPELTGLDAVHLQTALFAFLYGTTMPGGVE